MQVPPEDAVSNLSKWIKSATGHSFSFLEPANTDLIAHYIFVVLAVGCLFWFLWPFLVKIYEKLRGIDRPYEN